MNVKFVFLNSFGSSNDFIIIDMYIFLLHINITSFIIVDQRCKIIDTTNISDFIDVPFII